MPARLALAIAVPAAGAVLVLAAGVTMQTWASPEHDRIVVEPSTSLATSDDRQIVMAVDAVFVGHVDAVGPVEMVGSMPYTPFDVTVIDVMKGTVADQVTLSQLGGAVPRRHERVVVSGDSPLQAGYVYLFSAQQSAAVGTLVLVPGHGHIDLTADVLNPRALTAESARTIPRVAQMRSVMNIGTVN